MENLAPSPGARETEPPPTGLNKMSVGTAYRRQSPFPRNTPPSSLASSGKASPNLL